MSTTHARPCHRKCWCRRFTSCQRTPGAGDAGHLGGRFWCHSCTPSVKLVDISTRVDLDNRLELRVALALLSSLARLTGTAPAARA